MSKAGMAGTSPPSVAGVASDASAGAYEHYPPRNDAHAVVIGINQYNDPGIPQLQFARADAEAMHSVLVDPAVGRFRPENVVLLVDENATERRIRSEIGTRLPRRAGPDDTVFVYFAGHGAPVIDQKRNSTDGLEKYLVPHDAVADDLRASAVPMTAIADFFERIHACQIVFFIDSCYSGSAGGRSFDTPGFQRRSAIISDEFLESLGNEGRFVVTACATNEVSLEVPDLGHGIFTHHLVEGLKGAADADGNGLVTLHELYDYVFRKVTRHSRSIGGCMSPISKGSVRGHVYLTQPETKIKRRLREIRIAASDAFQKGTIDEAQALWNEALELDPHDQAANDGIALIFAFREEEKRRRREDERKKREEEDRKEYELQLRLQALNRQHHSTGGLPTLEFARAVKLLHCDPAELSKKDRRIRSLLLQLLDGAIDRQVYLTAVRVVEEARSKSTPKKEWWKVPPPHPTSEGVKFTLPEEQHPT